MPICISLQYEAAVVFFILWCFKEKEGLGTNMNHTAPVCHIKDNITSIPIAPASDGEQKPASFLNPGS